MSKNNFSGRAALVAALILAPFGMSGQSAGGTTETASSATDSPRTISAPAADTSTPKATAQRRTPTLSTSTQAIKATTTAATNTPLFAPVPTIPTPVGIDPFWYVAVVPFILAVGYVWYALRRRKPAQPKTHKKEREEKRDCPTLKKLMGDKLKELTDVRSQLKSAVESKLRDKIRDSTKGTERSLVLAKIEKAEQEYKKLKELFEKCLLSDENMNFVTCYSNPDLDGYACAIAYAEFLNKTGKKAAPVIFGTPHIEARYLVDKLKFKHENEISNLRGAKNTILVDASTVRGLDRSIETASVKEIVDHRKVNDGPRFKNAQLNIELVGAAATLITEKFSKENIGISKPAATLLYGAIVSNTLNFRATLTTERDIETAKWLVEKAEPSDTFAKEMFLAKSELSGSKLKETLWGDIAQFSAETAVLGIAQLEIVGAKKLLETRLDEILKELREIADVEGFDRTFLNILALDENCNYFVALDGKTEELLGHVLGITFEGHIAKKKGFLMRKQLIPILKEAIEKEPDLMA